MDCIGFINGEYKPIFKCMVSIEDRGYVFGDGVYDLVCTFNKTTFALEEHLDRFFKSMELIDIKSQYSRAKIKDIIFEGLKKVDINSTSVYLQMTRGVSPRKHAYLDDAVGNFMMVIRKKPTYENLRGGACAITVEDTRWKRCNVKSLNLLPNILAAKKAQRAGCIEAIFVRDGFAVECTASNLWYVKDNVLYTEPLSDYILKGISRTHVLKIAEKLGYIVIEKNTLLADFLKADEIFITSTTKLILPISHVDGRLIGEGQSKITLRLYDEYVKMVSQVCGKIDSSKI